MTTAAKFPAKVNKCTSGCRPRAPTTDNFGAPRHRLSGSAVPEQYIRDVLINTIPSHEQNVTEPPTSAPILEQIPRFRTPAEYDDGPLSAVRRPRRAKRTKAGHPHFRPKRRNEDRPEISGESRELSHPRCGAKIRLSSPGLLAEPAGSIPPLAAGPRANLDLGLNLLQRRGCSYQPKLSCAGARNTR